MRDERQRRAEQQGARAKERGGLIDRASGASRQQAQPQRREHHRQHPPATPVRPPISLGHFHRRLPASRLRSVTRDRPRSVHQMQSSAVARPPAGAGCQRRRAEVHAGARCRPHQPTSARAGDDRPRIPERAGQAQQHRRPGQARRSPCRNTAHVGGAEPDRAQQPTSRTRKLDAELEEKRRQQQRRHHQEEAEVDEVPQVGGAT